LTYTASYSAKHRGDCASKRKKLRSVEIGSVVKGEISGESGCCDREIQEIYRRLDFIISLHSKHFVSAPRPYKVHRFQGFRETAFIRSVWKSVL